MLARKEVVYTARRIRLVVTHEWHWPLFLTIACGALLASLTLLVVGANVNGAAWAVVQLVLVLIAVIDIRTRRIPNALVLPAAFVVVGIRALLERDALVESLLAGGVCFVMFLLFALALRGGFGMGDVKLAGLLGLALGHAVIPALVIGTVAGALGSALLVAVGPSGRRSTLAYGPYLCLGAVVAILVFTPPPLG
jgi:leader peptidase (prepilin peptidase)/N-methyltransferase